MCENNMLVKVSGKGGRKGPKLDVKVEPQGLLERHKGVMWPRQNVTGGCRG